MHLWHHNKCSSTLASTGSESLPRQYCSSSSSEKWVILKEITVQTDSYSTFTFSAISGGTSPYARNFLILARRPCIPCATDMDVRYPVWIVHGAVNIGTCPRILSRQHSFYKELSSPPFVSIPVRLQMVIVPAQTGDRCAGVAKDYGGDSCSYCFKNHLQTRENETISNAAAFKRRGWTSVCFLTTSCERLIATVPP